MMCRFDVIERWFIRYANEMFDCIEPTVIFTIKSKNAIYNESYLDELITQYEGTLFKNREDLLRMVSGGYVSEEEIGKRPLSKHIKDISQETRINIIR